MIIYDFWDENNYLDPDKIIFNVWVDPWNGCWNWMKSLNTPGYGQLMYNGVRYNAHRYSYMCFKGCIPNGYLVRHICHNRACCNPDHLELGTHVDNYNDSKSLYDAIIENRKNDVYINGVLYKGYRLISKHFGISQNTIVKYRDPATGVFNVDLYRENCYKGNVIPRI